MAAKCSLIAGMATMPTRETTAPIALCSVASQFDRLFLVLNGFREIPGWAQIDNVVPILPEDGRDYGAAGKLLGLDKIEKGSRTLYFCVDDDILYPRDFAKRVADLAMKKRNAIVGVHGSIIQRPFLAWKHDREVFWLRRRLWRARQVDVVATCGCAFFTDALVINHSKWPEQYKNAVDLYLAIQARQQGVDAWIVSRKNDWMTELESMQADSIYASLLNDDSVHNRLVMQYLAVCTS